MQHRHIPPRKLLVARCQPSKLLDVIEKAFNQIAIFVNMVIVFSRNYSIFPTRDDRFRVSRCDAQDELVGIIPFVGHDHHGFESVDQGVGLRYVRSLAASQKQTYRVPQSIHCGMNLCRQSATGPANGLRTFFFWAPAECWWARTMVLSKKSISKSGSFETALANRIQMPFSHQFANRTYTLCHFPNSLGKSRQGEPVRAIHRTASRNNLLSFAVTPQSLFFPAQSGSNRSHWSSRNSQRSMPPSPLGGITGRYISKSKQLIMNRP